jgi:uncharacterized membrane protein YeaQ/YmgE (transglycosylase-associated protein family)
MNFVVWLSIGGVVGLVASYLMGRKRDAMRTLLNIAAGAGGSLVAGIMVNSLSAALGTTSSAAKMGELLVCLGTAVMLLTVIAEMRHRGRSYHRILPESPDAPSHQGA